MSKLVELKNMIKDNREDIISKVIIGVTIGAGVLGVNKRRNASKKTKRLIDDLSLVVVEQHNEIQRLKYDR